MCIARAASSAKRASDGDVPDLGLGQESGQVEQPDVGSTVVVDSVFVLAKG